MLNEYEKASRELVQTALKDPIAQIPDRFKSAYYAHQKPLILKYILQINLMAQIAYALYTIADWIVLTDIQSLVAVTKLCYTALMIFITLWLYQRKPNLALFDLLLPTSIIGATALWFFNLNQSNTPYTNIYQYASLVFIVLANLGIQIRFLPSVLTSFCITAVIYIGVYYNTLGNPEATHEIFLFSLIYLPVLAFSIYISWHTTLKSRMMFLHQTLDEFNRRAFEKLAHTDALTGLNNRRSFEHLVDLQLQQSGAHPTPISLLIFDVDHFKLVNDRYGHDIGDQVLQKIAQVAHNHTRASDLIARFGGEEFTLLLPNTTVDEAFGIAERLRTAIAEMQIEISNKQYLKCTVSIGIAEVKPEMYRLKYVFRDADAALYEAKATGRNRTCMQTSKKIA